MNIEIDTIKVSVTGEDWEEDEIAGDLQWHLSRALEELSQSGLLIESEEVEFDTLDLPPVDWEDEIDKTGKLVQLIKNALEDTLNG